MNVTKGLSLCHIVLARCVLEHAVERELGLVGGLVRHADLHLALARLQAAHELFERDEIHVDAGGLHRGEVELLAGALAAALELVEHAADRHDNELARVRLLGVLDDAGGRADVVGLGQDIGLALGVRQHERVGVGLRRIDDLFVMMWWRGQ